MDRKRIGRHLQGGAVPEGERAESQERDALRDVFAWWATGVAILAVRDGARVHALTVSAFMPLSVDPPLVLASLGPNAAALAYLDPGTPFAVSILAAGQRGLASRFADPLPVGPTPFPAEGAPVVTGALASLECVVEEVRASGDHHLVTGRVQASVAGEPGPVLAYFQRRYHAVG